MGVEACGIRLLLVLGPGERPLHSTAYGSHCGLPLTAEHFAFLLLLTVLLTENISAMVNSVVKRACYLFRVFCFFLLFCNG